jgi:nucleotide-binding universal stress UspA family protein
MITKTGSARSRTETHEGTQRRKKVLMMTAAEIKSNSQTSSEQFVREGRNGPSVNEAPIVAAVDNSSASEAAVEAAVRLSTELDAPVVFVHVRRGPWAILGRPSYQRQLTAQMALARLVLDAALDTARGAGVTAHGEVLEGVPSRRIAEFARDRGARIVVVGSRRRRLSRSVSCSVARAWAGSVLIAGKGFRNRSRPAGRCSAAGGGLDRRDAAASRA